MEFTFAPDENHNEVYKSLKELIKARTGTEIPFSLRKNGNICVFIVNSFHLSKLRLTENKITAQNPWDIYVKVAQGLVTE